MLFDTERSDTLRGYPHCSEHELAQNKRIHARIMRQCLHAETRQIEEPIPQNSSLDVEASLISVECVDCRELYVWGYRYGEAFQKDHAERPGFAFPAYTRDPAAAHQVERALNKQGWSSRLYRENGRHRMVFTKAGRSIRGAVEDSEAEAIVSAVLAMLGSPEETGAFPRRPILDGTVRRDS